MVIGNNYTSHVLPPCVLLCQQHHLGYSKQQCTASIVINALHTPAVVQGCPCIFVPLSILDFTAFSVNKNSKAVAS